MNNYIIDVIVMVFPDGTTHWFKKMPTKRNEKDPNIKYMEEYHSRWREQNKELVENNILTNATCTIRMPESKYNNISADKRMANPHE